MNEVSAISEIAVSYALLTVGQNPDESKIMRLRCADAARELGLTQTADEIEKSIDGSARSLAEVIREYGYSKRAS